MMTDYEAAVDEAWDCLDAGEAQTAADLVRTVLVEHPDAIDAYVVLAASCAVPAEAIALLREGVRLGTAMRRDALSDNPAAGGTYDEGAHVRALNNLARRLRYDAPHAYRKESLVYARQALKIDPDDRAGTRILLMSWEAAEGHWAASRKIVRSCRKEPRTEIRYWLALHAFRGGAANADKLLDQAIATNPHMAAALDQRITLLHDHGRYSGHGSPEEAIWHARDAREGWINTPGALAWLASRGT